MNVVNEMSIGKVKNSHKGAKVLYLQPLRITPDEEYMYVQGCIGSECFDKFIIPSSKINYCQIENHLSSGNFTTWSGDSRYELLGASKYTENSFIYDDMGRLKMIVMFWLDEISEDDKKSDSKSFDVDEIDTECKEGSMEMKITTLDSSDGSVTLKTPIELSLPLLAIKK